MRFVQDQHRLLVGHEQAERVKIEIGSALAGHAAAAETEVAGRYMSTGMLARITLGEDDVRQALERPLSRIVAALKELLEQTPAQLASDIADRGVTLVGGGALLPGFADLIRNETGLPVSRDPEPLTTVARGAGAALSELDALRRSQRRRRSRRAPPAEPVLRTPKGGQRSRSPLPIEQFVEMQHSSIEDLRGELADLEAKAARLSQMRSHLHHQIDFGFETATTREREREVSDERNELHTADRLAQADAPRARNRLALGRATVTPPWPLTSSSARSATPTSTRSSSFRCEPGSRSSSRCASDARRFDLHPSPSAGLARDVQAGAVAL